jgi:hypothetical protein
MFSVAQADVVDNDVGMQFIQEDAIFAIAAAGVASHGVGI